LNSAHGLKVPHNSILTEYPNMIVTREADNPLNSNTPDKPVNTVRVGHQAITSYSIQSGQSLIKDTSVVAAPRFTRKKKQQQLMLLTAEPQFNAQQFQLIPQIVLPPNQPYGRVAAQPLVYA
jgi:hypothetical protein